MTSTNLNIILTNALCCISEKSAKLSDLYSKGVKCVDKELKELKLLNDYIDTLSCYKIDDINTVYAFRLPYSIYADPTKITRYYNLLIDGVVVATFVGDGITTIGELYAIFINTAFPGKTVDITFYKNEIGETEYVLESITLDCEVLDFTSQVIRISDDVVLTTSVAAIQKTGYCTPVNCLTETEYNTLIEYVMKACDICECQLTQ